MFYMEDHSKNHLPLNVPRGGREWSLSCFSPPLGCLYQQPEGNTLRRWGSTSLTIEKERSVLLYCSLWISKKDGEATRHSLPPLCPKGEVGKSPIFFLLFHFFTYFLLFIFFYYLSIYIYIFQVLLFF